jgi:D-serine deaminase-like pyridoxal phosphate-dependent protein
MPGITPVGLHAYDGHIRATDLAERTSICDEGFARVEALRKAIGQPLTVIAGGSPTFPIHAKRETGIQCSPGTFVYWDKGYADGFPDQPFQPAALVVTRVISLRGDTRLCLDLGHKSIAPENELGRRVFFLNGPELKAVGQSEEHLVVEAGPDHPYQIGDLFYGIPYHVCPTIALYDRACTVDSGRITGFWENIARDRILSI